MRNGRAQGLPERLPPPVVGVPGFEPGASSSRTMRATKLRHTPVLNRPTKSLPQMRSAVNDGLALSPARKVRYDIDTEIPSGTCRARRRKKGILPFGAQGRRGESADVGVMDLRPFPG